MLNFLVNKKMVTAFILVLCCTIEAKIASEEKITSKQQIVVQRVLSGNLEEEKKVFINAFQEAYKDVPLEVLKVESIGSFLQAAFEDEPIDLNKEGSQVICYVAKDGERVVGVIFYEPSKEDQNVVYVRQLAVDPKEQRKGIGARLMETIKHEFPSTNKEILATRKVNKQARNFYSKLGFRECASVPHGLNPELYIGYEKTLNN